MATETQNPTSLIVAPSPEAVARTKITETALRVSPKDWHTDWSVFAVTAVLVAGMLILAAMNRAVGLGFKPNLATLIPGIFGTMFLVSLFVERVIEVFVSVWVDRESAVHEQNLDYWQSRQGKLKHVIDDLIKERNGSPEPDANRKATIDQVIALKRAAIQEADANADSEEKALLPFEARTRKVSTWIGLAVGVFTAGAGFRFLDQIMVSPTSDTPGGIGLPQQEWYIAADILLTGAVLAGGSKLVHQIFSVYESFMQSTEKGLSDRSKSP